MFTYRPFFRIVESAACTLLLLCFLPGCSSEKLIDVEFPEYTPQLVVECYLEPGRPYTLALQESANYTAELNLENIAVQGALVVITHEGVSDTLENFEALPYRDPETGKITNYALPDKLVPYAPGTQFDLYIRDTQGREVTASTVMLDTVEMAPLELDINSENEAAVTARWPDFVNEESFYILSMHRNSLTERLVLDFSLDDRIGDGEDFVVSSWYWLDPGDTAIATVYHVEKAYWEFVTSAEDAENSNGNPFAQPAVVLSNVAGGVGVFTCHSLVRRSIVFPE